MPLPIHEVMRKALGTRDGRSLFIRLVDYDAKGIRIIACSATEHPYGGPSDTFFRTDEQGQVREELSYETMPLFQLIECALKEIHGNADLVAALNRRIDVILQQEKR